MAKNQSDLPGEEICSTKLLPLGSVPSWGMYLVSVVCLLLAGMFVFIAIDSLDDPLGAEILGLVILLAISLTFLACGLAAFASARKTSGSRNIRFHRGGVVIEEDNEEIFVRYADADAITIDLIQPSHTTKRNELARAGFSLITGHWPGLGRAIGNSRSTGIVQIKLPGERQPWEFQFDLTTTKLIAKNVTMTCEHAVIRRHSKHPG